MADLSALTATLQSLPGAAPSAAPAASASGFSLRSPLQNTFETPPAPPSVSLTSSKNPLSIVNPISSESTSATPTQPSSTDLIKGGLNIINPLAKTAPIRPLFGLPSQKQQLPYGGGIVGGAIDTGSRIIEGLTSVIPTTIANYRVAAEGGNPDANVKVPFDISRLGLANHPGQDIIQNSFSKLDSTFRQLQSAHPGRTGVNIAIASLSPINDALNAEFAGGILSSVASAGLKATAFSPELNQALQEYGLKNTQLVGEDLTNEIQSRFVKKATALIKDGDQLGLQRLGNATQVLGTHITGRSVPYLSKIGQILQDASRLGLQDSKYGFNLQNSTFPEIAPEAPAPQGLPGYADEPGQAPAMGLSTRRVTRVGGEHTTGDLFSSDGSGNFSKVAPKDSMPAVIKDGLDTFVVKKPEGFAVIEGKTGLQLGEISPTMAAAVSSAKQEIAANPNLDEHMNSKPLSPRYAEDTTPEPQQPGTGRKLAPYNESAPVAPVAKPSTLPGINPDQAEALTPEQVSPLADKAAAQYYDQKIKPAIDSGKAAVIGGDDLKDHFGKDYNDKNHPVYSKAAAQLYDRALTETKGDTVAFTGGGPGAGKTDILVNNIAKNLNGVVLDSNMSNPEVAARQIKAARDAGKKVLVYGILPDLGSSRVHTIIREMKGGHGISNKTFGRGHAGFPNTIKTLIENGILKPEEVKILDTRYTFSLHDAIMKVATGDYIKDPLATINKLKYNEADIEKKYARENYSRKNQQGLPEQRVRDNADTTPRVDRTDTRPRLAGGDRPSVEGSAGGDQGKAGKQVSRGTKDIDQLIRMLDREKQSLAQAEAHPEAHAKAYGAGKADEYRKKIKQLVRRIEEDHTPRALKEKANKAPKVYPLEQHISEMSTQMGFLEDVIAGNRARALSRYANKSGELPEVLGGQKGMFANEGDSIVTQLGYPDSETARAAYSKYLLQKKRLFVVRNNLRVLKDTLREMKITDTDERSLTKLLNKNASLSEKQISDLAKKGKAPLTEKQIEERKQLAEDRQKRLIGQMAATEPAIGWQAPEQTLSALLQAQPLTLGEFEKMNNAFSLKQMVVDTSTSVNKKVNLIDHFLRTPDRVLEKIGLKPIADNLRHSYESYVAELPGHIEVISNWAKRVPEPGANERIFDWLDGQTIRDKFKPGGSKPLAGEELVVAKEIRQYLHDWAERLGLPDDNRISHYITHVFAIGEVAKEFDEDVAKLIKDKQPGSVYDPFLEKRLGKKGYIRDTWASLDAYAKRAVRKANMDPVLDQMKTAAARLEESQATYLKKYANLINMRPTDIDNLTDNLLKSIFGYRFGQRPTALLTRTARQWIYRSMLGLNFSSAIKNLTQGVNTFAVLGARYTLRGYRELMMHPNSQELEDAGILKQDFIQDRTLSSTRKAIQKIDKGLFTLFDLAEKINRGSAYFGAKAKAMKLGASEYDAMQYAKKIVRDTQFQFGSIDTPVGLNSDMAKVLTQFMSFGFKQAEFAAENIKAKNYAGIVRYILGALFMTYVVGKVFNIKGRDFIPGYSFTKFGTPPTLALPLAIFKAVVDAPDAYGHPRSLSQKGQDIFSNIPFPASIQARNTYKLVTGLGPKNSSASASGGSFGTGKKLKPMKGASAATGRKLKPFGR